MKNRLSLLLASLSALAAMSCCNPPESDLVLNDSEYFERSKIS